MLTFDELWKNHPTITGDDSPCQTNGWPNFTDQCAIRMGVCLARCGVDTARIPGVTHCWYGHSKSQGHTFRAEELAKGLARHPALLPGVQKIQKIDPEEFKNILAGIGVRGFFRSHLLIIIGVYALTMSLCACCQVPCDYIPRKSYPLFRANEVLRLLIGEVTEGSEASEQAGV